MMLRWSVKGAHRLVLPGAQQRAEQIEGRFLYDAPVRKWLDEFLDHWIGTADEPAEQR